MLSVATDSRSGVIGSASGSQSDVDLNSAAGAEMLELGAILGSKQELSGWPYLLHFSRTYLVLAGTYHFLSAFNRWPSRAGLHTARQLCFHLLPTDQDSASRPDCETVNGDNETTGQPA